MKNRKNIFFIHLPFTIFSILLVLSSASCSKSIEPSELFEGQYYDYEIFSDYTFRLDNIKLEVCEVHALAEEEYYHFADCPVLYPMYLQFDDASMTALITSSPAENDLKYYLFRDEKNRMLLIPEKNTNRLFEQRRPLAFYLQEQNAERQ